MIGISYKMFKNGFLPNEGGWLRQPNKFIQAMLFIDSEIDRERSKNGK